MTFHRPLFFAAAVLASPAFAVGDLSTPPTPTQTTEVCPEGAVLDADASACVVIQDSHLDDDTLIQTARELAYASRFEDAINLLGRASDQGDTMVLTYLGFSHRSAGRFDVGLAYYDQALEVNPDNLLARAYMGMAFIEAGEPALARFELAQIRQRGGSGSWPERALAEAIETGQTLRY